ncbi:hypothetical protein EX30DRAFT_117507 [Ascodesmis nigricans]|uniref:Uncharacterized protein n=1 Tax=Ascodesmis nigricans TaxID=341454 RepID=A0A4S2MPQ7_9PEZI|nr:hypothetical protein EX30DRAFT_117507 [Ascodesmis nigricans]
MPTSIQLVGYGASAPSLPPTTAPEATNAESVEYGGARGGELEVDEYDEPPLAYSPFALARYSPVPPAQPPSESAYRNPTSSSSSSSSSSSRAPPQNFRKWHQVPFTKGKYFVSFRELPYPPAPPKPRKWHNAPLTKGKLMVSFK